ncbi:MAG: translation initiation factor IF-2 N-terminal domain-containing protein [Acidimicrobiales bacterium]
MATVRIYKVAELLGTTSQEVLALLKRDHGIELKSASSTIEEVVARSFVERVARQRNVALPGGDLFADTPHHAPARGGKKAPAPKKVEPAKPAAPVLGPPRLVKTVRPAAPPAAPAEPARPLEELLEELDALVGLAPVKAEVRLVANLIQVQNLRRERGLPVAEASRHLIFTGNPGTGKTTVARLLARIYRTLGVVDKGHLVETDRSQLVAGFVGQTAIQVRKVVEGALGGVLLVDEAYALARGDQRDFGQEAIDSLVKLIEDHRDAFVVIAAGYPDEMATFVGSNPGLRSRFPRTIAFPDYGDEELVAIFVVMASRSAYRCTPEALDRLGRWFAAQPRDKGFGNARLARNLFEASVARQASRVVAIESPTDDDLMALTADDVGPAPGPA